MISVRRILAVVKKDLDWSMKNMKLLGLMIAPLIMSVLLSRDSDGVHFSFTVIFINIFTGIFLTSYLVIEEKNNGTLNALLTTPLRNHELLIAKFLFGLIISLTFSVLASVLNGKLGIILNPLSLLNLICLSGVLCFIGYCMGIFFKNEQEMSIFAPIIMLAFLLSDLVEQSSNITNVKRFFPDYHLSRVLSELGTPWSELLYHSLSNVSYFLVALIIASFYTRFYFSNQNEKRINIPVATGFVSLFITFIVSGFITPQFVSDNKTVTQQEGLTIYSFKTDYWSGEFKYDSELFFVKPVIEVKNEKIYLIKSKEDQETEFAVITRSAKEKEKTVELRYKKVTEDEKRLVVGYDNKKLNDIDYKVWSYFKGKNFYILAESFCSGQILQVSLKTENFKFKDIKGANKQFNSLLNSVRAQCSKEKR